jgi:UDP-MurNAc hydroxylase
MRITSLGHAGFCVETSHATIIMDPWLSPTGAFDSSWFQFPRNHHLSTVVESKLQDDTRDRFVYISHEHKDHFDLPFLESLRARNFTLVIGQFQRTALEEALASYDCLGLQVLGDGERLAIPGGSIRLYVEDSGLNRDSGILVEADGERFLNANDCKLNDRLRQIVEDNGSIDVFTCQFSGATWHPTCYRYARDRYESISRKKMFSKFEAVAQAIQVLEPSIYLPSAGPPCFLDPDLLYLNFEPVNIFPRAPRLIEYLKRRLPASTTLCPDLQPGDAVDVGTSDVLQAGGGRFDETQHEAYVRCYAAEYRDYFDDLKESCHRESPSVVLGRLRAAMQSKLAAFQLRARMHTSLYFGLLDAPGCMLEINFEHGTVERVPSVPGPKHYSIAAPAWQVQRVLDGHITWEDFSLTFRARLEREPDLYQTILQGFLILESEDLDWFCSRMLDLEQRRERIVVEADGRRYSITRFCPHQGADLAEGRCGPPGSWVCPRHGWQFDLERDGNCTMNDTSIDAVALEDA